MVRIVIANGDRILRETLQEKLCTQAGFEIAALCSNSSSLIETIQAIHPALVLLDTDIKPLAGLAATHKIRFFSAVKIIAMSASPDTGTVASIMEAGANGFINSNCPAAELSAAIRTVMRGNEYLGAGITAITSGNKMQPAARVPDTKSVYMPEIRHSLFKYRPGGRLTA